MIQAGDLRVGNWAQIEIDNQIYYTKIQGIQKRGVSLSLSIRGYQWDDLEDVDPIPVTPEILEKAGFEKSGSDFWVKDGKPSFQWGEGNDGDWFITYQTQYGLDWNDAYHVRTLHQLQNLYFALTGEELEINL